MIQPMASMWGCCITVLRSDCCKELCFRHDVEMKKVDFIVIFNCDDERHHFTADLRVDKLMIKANKLTRVHSFNYDMDMLERTERVKVWN